MCECEDLLRPSDPLVCDPLVAVEHRATLVIYPRVDRAIRPPEKVHKKVTKPPWPRPRQDNLVFQKTKLPAFGWMLSPSLGKIVRPPADTEVR